MAAPPRCAVDRLSIDGKLPDEIRLVVDGSVAGCDEGDFQVLQFLQVLLGHAAQGIMISA